MRRFQVKRIEIGGSRCANSRPVQRVPHTPALFWLISPTQKRPACFECAKKFAENHKLPRVRVVA